MKKLGFGIIFILLILGFQFQTPAENTKLRVTINVNAYGRSVSVTMNGTELKKITGGQAQAIQLYHEKHHLLKGAPEDYKDNFCLKEGKNTIKIGHTTITGETPSTLEISILAIGYDIPLLKYTQKPDLKEGEASGEFELYAKQPEGFKTIILE
jgi:hypothetical protein